MVSKIVLLINVMRWKSKMKKLKNTDIFTSPDGWEQCYKALYFLPEDQREAFLSQFISTMIGM